jgi:hypothetical protein
MPDRVPCRLPYKRFAKNSGPGASTPEAEIAITSTAKRSRLIAVVAKLNCC